MSLKKTARNLCSSMCPTAALLPLGTWETIAGLTPAQPHGSESRNSQPETISVKPRRFIYEEVSQANVDK
jgi:hypothetical protein